ncbi:hypothetical protein F5141DRAFT_1168755 [Pisolithus sp. B1]|nr:hypothetical protein F5141DRAFT_1168755 [Pisolithus sp. B1]
MIFVVQLFLPLLSPPLLLPQPSCPRTLTEVPLPSTWVVIILTNLSLTGLRSSGLRGNFKKHKNDRGKLKRLRVMRGKPLNVPHARQRSSDKGNMKPSLPLSGLLRLLERRPRGCVDRWKKENELSEELVRKRRLVPVKSEHVRRGLHEKWKRNDEDRRLRGLPPLQLGRRRLGV